MIEAIRVLLFSICLFVSVPRRLLHLLKRFKSRIINKLVVIKLDKAISVFNNITYTLTSLFHTHDAPFGGAVSCERADASRVDIGTIGVTKAAFPTRSLLLPTTTRLFRHTTGCPRWGKTKPKFVSAIGEAII